MHIHFRVFFFLLLPFFSSIYKIRENVFQEHHTLKEKELQTGPKASHGYGGKFCVEQYSMDKVSGRRLSVLGPWLCGLLVVGHVVLTFFLSLNVSSWFVRGEICSQWVSVN